MSSSPATGIPTRARPRSRSPASRSCWTTFTSALRDIPVVITPRRGRAQESDQSADRRLPRVQRLDRSDAGPRPGHRRGGARGAGRGGLRRVGRTGCPGRRIDRARGAGRRELPDRELPRLSDGHLRAWTWPRAPTNQAQKFGAEIVIGSGAARLACDRRPYALEIGDGQRLPARAVIIATGAEYRRLPIDGLSRFEGAGVYYAATFMEAQLCAGEEVVVVGGGNSAGQAAVFLAQTARRVHMLDPLGGPGGHHVALPGPSHRGPSRHRASRPHGNRRPRGGRSPRADRLARQSNRAAGESHAIRHVFTMTGAVPNTRWMQRLRRPRRQGVHQDGLRPVAGGPGRRRVAPRPPPASAGDQSPGGLRDRRRPLRELETRRLGRGRGIDRDRRRAPGAVRVRGPRCRTLAALTSARSRPCDIRSAGNAPSASSSVRSGSTCAPARNAA